LAWEDIISNHSVRSEIDCAFNCGNEPTCDEFKYKFGTNSPSVNCQLSNTTGKNNMANYDGQGWVFFIDVTKKLVCILKKCINNSRGKYKINECLINVCKSDTHLS
jgi:hypothetical protein